MSKPVLNTLDFNKTELQNARFQNLGVDPGGLTANDKGLFWIDGDGIFKFWDGAVIKVVGEATGGNATTFNGQGPGFYLNRANHTGDQEASTISDFEDAVLAVSPPAPVAAVGDTATLDFALVDGTLTGTVLNSPLLGGQNLAHVLNRANHTGAQAVGTINGFDEAVDDRVANLITPGTNIGAVYNDAAGTLTINANINGGDAATLDGLDSTAFEQIAGKNQANGYAGLGADGKLAANQIPAIALTDTHVVANIAARNALVVEEGDVAIVLGDRSYIYDGAAWQELITAADGVQSVVGSAPITSTGGVNPQIGLANLGVLTAHIGDAQITAAKLAVSAVNLAGTTVTGTLPLTKGGTGATTAVAARTAIGATTKVSANIGDGVATQIVVNHNLNTRDVQVDVFRNSGQFESVIVDIERTSVNAVTIRFANAPAANAFRAVVVG